MLNNTQSRKWTLTINNAQECGLTHETIVEKLMLFVPAYFCMSDEMAGTGTFHTHVFFYAPSPVRFGTVKNRFPTAHIEKAIGSATQNREYIAKGGKWADSDKHETAIEGSFYECGELPAASAEKNPQMYQLIADIRSGLNTIEIIEKSPNLAFRIRDIDLLRQTLLAERYSTEKRNIEVAYIYGTSATGKTFGIFERHNARDIYRITNYKLGRGVTFDGYCGQDVIVFEEFHSQIPIEDMLNYLDIYPLSLPARYNDKTACYKHVYITSNAPLEEQYRHVQIHRAETYRAFLRRINHVIEYRLDGSTITHKKYERGNSYE